MCSVDHFDLTGDTRDMGTVATVSRHVQERVLFFTLRDPILGFLDDRCYHSLGISVNRGWSFCG